MKVDLNLIPEWDETNKRPKSKMPDCFECGEDEFAMIDKWSITCYNCGFHIHLQYDYRKTT